MDRTNDTGNVGGMFSAGGGAVLPTVLSADYMNMLQEELYYLIDENGITHDRTNTTQVHEAIAKMISDSINFVVNNGRLTTTSGTPVTIADVTGGTHIYFTPYKGNKIGIYDGSSWTIYDLTEIDSTPTLAVDTNYDVFVYDDSGTLKLEFLAWTTDNVRVALGLQDGVKVRGSDNSRRYVGAIRSDGSGTLEDSEARRFISNYYNQVERSCKRVDTTNSWTYGTAAWRQANADTNNKCEVLIGIQEEPSEFDLSVVVDTQSGQAVSVGIGLNSTSVNSAQILLEVGLATTSASLNDAQAQYRGILPLGYTEVNWLEYVRTGTNPTFYGDGGTTVRQSGMLGKIRA